MVETRVSPDFADQAVRLAGTKTRARLGGTDGRAAAPGRPARPPRVGGVREVPPSDPSPKKATKVPGLGPGGDAGAGSDSGCRLVGVDADLQEPGYVRAARRLQPVRVAGCSAPPRGRADQHQRQEPGAPRASECLLPRNLGALASGRGSERPPPGRVRRVRPPARRDWERTRVGCAPLLGASYPSPRRDHRTGDPVPPPQPRPVEPGDRVTARTVRASRSAR